MPSTQLGLNPRKNPTNLTGSYTGSRTGSQVDIKTIQIERTTQLKKPQPENTAFPMDTSVNTLIISFLIVLHTFTSNRKVTDKKCRWYTCMFLAWAQEIDMHFIIIYSCHQQRVYFSVPLPDHQTFSRLTCPGLAQPRGFHSRFRCRMKPRLCSGSPNPSSLEQGNHNTSKYLT